MSALKVGQRVVAVVDIWWPGTPPVLLARKGAVGRIVGTGIDARFGFAAPSLSR